MNGARAYIITPNRRQGGVCLSLAGSWGNLPYRDVDAARRAARADAVMEPFTVEQQGC